MIDKEKVNRVKGFICEAVGQIQQGDIQSSSKVEYYEKLAKLYYYLGLCCEADEQEAFSQHGMSMNMGPAWPTDGMGGIGMENASGRRMRGGNGQYMSGAMAAPYSGASYGGGSREQLMQLMQDPNLSYDAREHLRKAMEGMR